MPRSSKSKPPSQLNGKSVVISYLETARAKPVDGGVIATRKIPFKLIVYASAEGKLFNRLRAGNNAKSSDQTSGARDLSQLADRNTIFDKQKMSTANNYFGGQGSRTIEAVFDETFSNCTATVVTKILGEYAKRRLMSDGFELLYSASASDITCKVVSGNELVEN